MIADWKKDLFKEKSLWHVYRESKRLPKSHFNKFVYAISGLAITSVCLAWIAQGKIDESYHATILVSEIAFDFSAQILGFLIGGFAIFATVTDDKLMIRLAQTPMDKNGLSVFKHVFFNFLAVFYIFIATIAWAILIQIVGSLSLVNLATIVETPRGRCAMVLINSVAFSIMTGLIVFAIVRLKSFIWNIYQAFITFLGVSDLMKNEGPKSD